MKKTGLLVLVLALTALVPGFSQRGGRSQGETVQIKLASPLPANSEWGKKLVQIAAQWQRISNGQIKVILRQDGVEGGEAKMLQSLDANQIQAAVFTSFGLSAIDPAILTVSCPFLIRNDKELDYVMDQLETDFDDKVEKESKYVIIAWSKAGWINFFSKNKVLTPADLRKEKLATNAEANDLNTVFRTMGFQLVETDTVDVGTKMASGALTAVYQVPASVAAFKLYTVLKNMLATNIAPVLGGIVMNKVTWDKINPAYRDEIITTTRRLAAEVDVSMQKTTQDAIASMTRGGLIINRLSPAQEQGWEQDLGQSIPKLLGTTFDTDTYNKIVAALAEYRKGQ